LVPVAVDVLSLRPGGGIDRRVAGHPNSTTQSALPAFELRLDSGVDERVFAMFRTTTVKSSDHRRPKLASMMPLLERTSSTLPSTRVKFAPPRRNRLQANGRHYVIVRPVPEAKLDPACSSLHSEIFGRLYPPINSKPDRARLPPASVSASGAPSRRTGQLRPCCWKKPDH
jgi:hypothetical protein